MDVRTAIERRRSIRKYKPAAVEKEKLEMLMEAARLAPSSSNRQPWRFFLAEKPGIKAEIARACYQDFIQQAPVIILCYADLKHYRSGQVKALARRIISGDPRYQKRVSVAFLDAAIAIEHMVLQAVELGLGTCWVRLAHEGKLSKIIKIPDDYVFVSLLTVGYPDEAPSPRPRLERKEIMFDGD